MDPIITIDKRQTHSRKDGTLNGAGDPPRSSASLSTNDQNLSSLLKDYDQAIRHYREMYSNQQGAYTESIQSQDPYPSTHFQFQRHREYLTFLQDTLLDCEQACLAISHLTGKERTDYIHLWKKHMEALLKTHKDFIHELETNGVQDKP